MGKSKHDNQDFPEDSMQSTNMSVITKEYAECSSLYGLQEDQSAGTSHCVKKECVKLKRENDVLNKKVEDLRKEDIQRLRAAPNTFADILNNFCMPEFWYVDQGIVVFDCDGSSYFWKTLHMQEEKWWLPVPRVPAGCLQESSRKQLDHKRECTHYILKATSNV